MARFSISRVILMFHVPLKTAINGTRTKRQLKSGVLGLCLFALVGCGTYGTYGTGDQERLSETETLYGEDWRMLTKGAELWLDQRDPYGPLLGQGPGTFAYPPTALSWIALFVPFGGMSIWVWNGIQLAAWVMLIWRTRRTQLLLLIWTPLAIHFYLGQNTLMYTLVLWAVALMPRRGFLAGLAVAWALTKPQVVVVLVIWLLWRSWKEGTFWPFVGGIALGTLLLALPATLHDPEIWLRWFTALVDFRQKLVMRATWQGPWIILAVPSIYLWHRAGYGGWPWLLSALLIPYTSFYSMVVLLPSLRPHPLNRWTALGLFGTLLLFLVPQTEASLGWILTAYLALAWLINGGPQPAQRSMPPSERTLPEQR